MRDRPSQFERAKSDLLSAGGGSFIKRVRSKLGGSSQDSMNVGWQPSSFALSSTDDGGTTRTSLGSLAGASPRDDAPIDHHEFQMFPGSELDLDLDACIEEGEGEEEAAVAAAAAPPCQVQRPPPATSLPT